METYDPNKREWWEWIIFAISCMMIAFMLTCCTTIKYVPIEKVVTKDSIVIKKEYDSIEIKVKEYMGGDTIFRDSIVFRYISRCDTIFANRVDSIPYPVEVVKEVPKALNSYQKTMIGIGWLFIVIVVGYIVSKLLKWYIKIR